METKKAESVRTTIDLPADLNALLRAEAARAKRSRHAQMLFALEKFFETARGNGKKERAK